MKRIATLLAVLLGLSAASASFAAGGNERIESFEAAKKMLTGQVYRDHRRTLYCDVPFDKNKATRLPAGFEKSIHARRAGRIEYEHVVAAENFGRTFPEWREGSPSCVTARGERFKGRKCAEAASREYRLMQADMHNLFPAVGSVNALRSNFRFTQFPKDVPCTFGSCCMKVADRRAEPPDAAKGVVARTHFYMARTYPRFTLSAYHERLFAIWNEKHPVTAWECERQRRIAELQGNENAVTAAACRAAGL